jgi:Flp pilus assembly protein TadG
VNFHLPGTRYQAAGAGYSRTAPLRQSSRGQALVEFALVAPVMLLLLLVAVDFGRLFFTHVAVNNVAREATYHAAAHAADESFNKEQYEAAVEAAGLREVSVQGQGGEGALTVSAPVCSTPAGTNIDCHAASAFAAGSGNRVTVTASQPFTFLTPLIGDLLGGNLTLTASATGPVLNPIEIEILPGTDQESPPVCTTQASFDWNIPDEEAAPRTVQFTSPNDLDAQEWDFGDGVLSTDPDPTHTFASSGNYTVTLTVDCDSYEAMVSVGNAPPPGPAMCTVPDFVGQYWSNVGGTTAELVWEQAGFTGKLTNNAGKKEIKSQTRTANSLIDCTLGMNVRQN